MSAPESRTLRLEQTESEAGQVRDGRWMVGMGVAAGFRKQPAHQVSGAHQEVIFPDEADPISSPMKAKGVGELGLCGVGAAIANAIYNATGVRVGDYPIAPDKLIDGLPDMA